MVNASGHNHQVALLQPNPHPIIALAPDIEVSSTFQNIPDLLILVQMFVEEVLDLLFIIRERGGGDLDLVAVLVRAGAGDGVHGVKIFRVVVVQDAELGEIVWVDGAAGVMGEALVALVGAVSGGFERIAELNRDIRASCRTSRLSLWQSMSL